MRMLHEVFYWLFNMSIAAALTGMLVLFIRRIRKIPRRFIVFLWAVPFLRMTIPVGMNSPCSLMALLSKAAAKTVVVYQKMDGAALSMMNFVRAADAYFPVTYQENTLEQVFMVSGVIWLVIAVLLLLMLGAAYWTAMHDIKNAVPLQENIFLSAKVASPAVYGIAKPRIVLPLSYKGKENALVILHEKTHIRTLDNLWRMMAFAIACVHWFNPFGWLFLKCFLGDLELACDERVLIKAGQGSAGEYALSLLECRQHTQQLASAYGGARIKTRIENILSFRKLSLLSAVGFTVLIGVISYVLLTNAG